MQAIAPQPALLRPCAQPPPATYRTPPTASAAAPVHRAAAPARCVAAAAPRSPPPAPPLRPAKARLPPRRRPHRFHACRPSPRMPPQAQPPPPRAAAAAGPLHPPAAVRRAPQSFPRSLRARGRLLIRDERFVEAGLVARAAQRALKRICARPLARRLVLHQLQPSPLLQLKLGTRAGAATRRAAGGPIDACAVAVGVRLRGVARRRVSPPRRHMARLQGAGALVGVPSAHSTCLHRKGRVRAIAHMACPTVSPQWTRSLLMFDILSSDCASLWLSTETTAIRAW
eukprot:137913-Chlamydomonas_euryale.AAC.3